MTASSASATEAWRKRLRIVVVEDDTLLSALLSELLDELGYDICATTGTEAGAVAAALRYRPDLMIVDARLSEGSGISAMRTIEQTTPMPHLFITGDGRLDLPLGATLLRKPFRERDLARAVAGVLAAG